jgi:signal transduction histidine kinase
MREGETVVRVIEMITDVTARRVAEDEASRAARLATVGEVAAALAHEVRNAATTTKLTLQVWAEKAMHKDDARSASVALSSIERMESLVGRLLKLARPVRPEVSPTDAIAVVRDAIDLVRPEAHRRGVKLVERFASSPCTCLADSASLGEAVVNLLLNAVQALDGARDGGALVEVIVRGGADAVAGTPDGTLIEILDNGPGIAPDVESRVFEAFFTTKPQGTGLGLAITRRIIAS